MTVEAIAEVCHEANRAFCKTIGDTSHLPWSVAPQWQKDSAIAGVEFHLNNPDALPSDSHNSWMAEKQKAGWTYGVEKNPETKEHPCMVPYKELPKEQQLKDTLFIAVVHSLS